MIAGLVIRPNEITSPRTSPAMAPVLSIHLRVPGAGLDPACLSAAAFKAAVYACSTTRAAATRVTNAPRTRPAPRGSARRGVAPPAPDDTVARVSSAARQPA